jgi:hypothetical protein
MTWAVLLTAAAGCGGRTDNLPREPVSGQVIMDDQPLPRGFITFRPDYENAITEGASPIRNGQFSMSRNDGLVPGPYKVMITMREEPDPTKKAPNPDLNPFAGFAKELVPARYNFKTTLTVNVKEGGPNHFDFPLQSK